MPEKYYALLLLLCFSCEGFEAGQKKLGKNFSFVMGSKPEEGEIIWCYANASPPCRSGTPILPLPYRHTDADNRILEYVSDAVADDSWIPAMTKRMDGSSLFWVIDQGLVADTAGWGDPRSPRKGDIRGPFDLQGLNTQKALRQIDLKTPAIWSAP